VFALDFLSSFWSNKGIGGMPRALRTSGACSSLIWGGGVGRDQEAQDGGKVVAVADDMEVLGVYGQFIGTGGRQTAADDDGLRAMALGLVDESAALGRGGVCHATSVDDDQVGAVGGFDLGKARLHEKLANLLALILIYFAA
jgi:hypothetical protein